MAAAARNAAASSSSSVNESEEMFNYSSRIESSSSNNAGSAVTIHTGGHRPSPYLRRFRLPHIGASSTDNNRSNNSTCCSYDDLLSPIDDFSKMIVVIEANKRHQLFAPIAAANRPTSIVNMDVAFRSDTNKLQQQQQTRRQQQTNSIPPPIAPHRSSVGIRSNSSRLYENSLLLDVSTETAALERRTRELLIADTDTYRDQSQPKKTTTTKTSSNNDRRYWPPRPTSLF